MLVRKHEVARLDPRRIDMRRMLYDTADALNQSVLEAHVLSNIQH